MDAAELTDRAACLPTERLEAEITTLAGHLAAAECRWLLLVAEFDRREAWPIGAASPRATGSAGSAASSTEPRRRRCAWHAHSMRSRASRRRSGAVSSRTPR